MPCICRDATLGADCRRLVHQTFTLTPETPRATRYYRCATAVGALPLKAALGVGVDAPANNKKALGHFGFEYA